MKHSGKALRSGLKIVGLSLTILLILEAAVYLCRGMAPIWPALGIVLLIIWALIAGFTFYFFRDPDAKTPAQPGLIISPAHGTVDVIDQLAESQFLNAPCHRISIFLSVVNVHVQNAPIAGKIAYLKANPGQFLNALRTDCGLHNENVLIGFESTEAPGEKVSARLIAGLIARRIVPFVKVGDTANRGERISLIQFGSRCDLHFPLHYKIQVKLGDKVVGGETVMATKS